MGVQDEIHTAGKIKGLDCQLSNGNSREQLTSLTSRTSLIPPKSDERDDSGESAHFFAHSISVLVDFERS